MDATFHLDNAVFNYRVAGVMIENNHVLVHKQVNEKHWALPGGRVEVLEDSRTSIKREMKEELGLHIKIDSLLWITENFFEYNHKHFHEIGLYYRISTPGQGFKFTADAFFGEEGERLIYQWIPLSDLDSILLYPEFLKQSLNKLPENPEHIIIEDYKK